MPNTKTFGISVRIILLMLIVLAVFGKTFCQTLELEAIRQKNGTGQIVKYVRLSDNYATQVKNIYALYFSDGSVRIYNHDADSLEAETFHSFVSKFQTYVGASDKEWKIFEERVGFKNYGWRFKAGIDRSRFDSIEIIYFNHFIGHKKNRKLLFYFEENKDSLMGFNELPVSPAAPPKYYANGLLVKTSSKGKNKDSRILYLDYETGKMKSRFQVDSILNYPDYFVDFTLVRQRNNYLVYSYKQDRVIDSSFTKYYIVPLYEYPVILKDGYVGLGESKWINLDIKNATSIEFKINSTLVTGIVETREGNKYTIDLRRKKIIE